MGRREEKKMRRKESEEKGDRRGEVRERVRVEDRKVREKSRAFEEEGRRGGGRKSICVQNDSKLPTV